mmetsp:Transcript_96373/g.167366  ORF Transcript_96373/g.167366 Transcript_96373/m.167366 type:complete len:648 (-) Transcript_96373:265-2208(-)
MEVRWHRLLALAVLLGQALPSARAQVSSIPSAPRPTSRELFLAANRELDIKATSVQANGIQTCSTPYDATNLTSPNCSQFVKEDFQPYCIPPQLRSYTFLSGMGKGKEPYVYNTWMFIQACGLNATAWRANHQMPRRAVMTQATEAILINWGVYFFATIFAAICMNIFYVSPRGKRCWGCFPEHPDPDDFEPGCTYQKVVAPVYMLCVLPLAIMLLAACCYQFGYEQWNYHAKIKELRQPFCYPVPHATGAEPGVLVDTPPEVCEDIMRLDWVCNKEMLQILLLTVFCCMDNAFVVGVKLYTLVIGCISCMRVACCCCGCMLFKAICKRPDCACSSTCSTKICCSWFWCHPLASCCCNFCLIPLVIGLYFFAGTFGALLAYGSIACVVFGILGCLELIIRQLIQLASCGKCEIHGMPTSKYFMSLFPTASAPMNPGSWQKQEKSTNVGDMYAYDHPINKAEHPTEPGWEENTMGAPCHAVTLAYPVMPLILSMPIILVTVVCTFCFLWEDYLTRILAWGYGDMEWYYAPGAMEDGMKAWTWWYQVFNELKNGLTDAFSEIFTVWWHFLRDIFSGDSHFYEEFSDQFSKDLNPLRLFETGDIDGFKKGLIFYRFVLTFIFTCCRATALVNWSGVKEYMAEEELDYLYH